MSFRTDGSYEINMLLPRALLGARFRVRSVWKEQRSVKRIL
jgi:hypothetical protein